MTSTVSDTAPTRARHSNRAPRPNTVLVVGAGPGGLAAAMLLAKAGLDVHVVERKSHVGGRCSAIEEQGFRFDLGPTFFLYPRVLERIFKLIGRDLRTEIPMVRLDPQYRIAFGGGGELNCTPNLEQLETEVARLSPTDAQNVRRFLDDNRVKMEQFRPCLERPFSGWRDLIRWQLIKLFPTLRPWASLDAELGRYFSDERIRLAFSFQSKYLGMSPFNCPSLFSILSFLEYEYGVWHPMGGCAAVSEGMARVAREMGVRITLNEDVKEVLFEGRKAVGIRTQSGEHRADALVINADFAHAMTKLVPNHLRRKWTDEKIEKKKYSCSTFMMYLGVEGRFEDVPHHTIHTAADYVNNLTDIEQRHVLSEDPSFYVQNATPTDPSLAPPGMSTLYVLAPVTHQHPNVDWVKEAPAFRAKLLKQLEKIGLGGVEKRIRFEKVVTPADWEQTYNVYRGATFSLAHSWGQMLHLRPRNRFDELESVYLVGGGTHPGSGLPVIYESARITSRLLLEDFAHDAEWLGAPGAAELPAPVAHW
ncbi:phytoene desaturase : Phytoene desaturase OS=Candidatus Entotheonella sp. TSY1 GN=ETSY1_19775 PE=4 SV=1: Amino_oxidase [Gemmata massiliana]|uniref:Amine oxidase domain-containing protein n=1 Tax=Gemmata massiliana TaxID=1210884 RepID=A0A6P2D5F4_9BACT|nr:phytoene desaturase family protein [Gemmata massiliana]VTR94650.1 phytoene desaturase : Phytoene desaturase OS=Candidatus Entotheonella sp. TSY1 GN=ETSY1_19775 PE=4 SV=1: Amino_oxidase [Gemmata massiliana]